MTYFISGGAIDSSEMTVLSYKNDGFHLTLFEIC